MVSDVMVSNVAGGIVSSKPSAIVLDAIFVIAYVAREPQRYSLADTALYQRVSSGLELHAPHLMIMEVAYVLCGKLQSQTLTVADHNAAIANFHSLMSVINLPPAGDANLLNRAEQIRQGYGCSHSADGFCLALAEQLCSNSPCELLTFDSGIQKHAAATAPTVRITVL